MNRVCGEPDCYMDLERGHALFKQDTMPASDAVYRCYIHHQGPVAAVVVAQPLAELEITVQLESG